tara:strand:- start:10053 stop:11609 length:1557 start_codon:yes stop_codon:yes gene_type:complete
MDSMTSHSQENSNESITIGTELFSPKKRLILKSALELTAEEERIEAEKLGDAYFITQKIAGKFPALVSKIHSAILANHDDKNGSLTVAIKNQNNSLREIKSISGTSGRHATSNIINISQFDAQKINQTLKRELKENFSQTGDLLNRIHLERDNLDLLEQLSQDVQQWELTPKIRGLFFIEIRKITAAFKTLNLRGKSLIKEKSRLRYESVVIDLICKNQLPGLDKKQAKLIIDDLAKEILALEILCGTSISIVLEDIKQLTIFDRKLIESQNKLVMSCQKYINYIVNTFARKNGLSDTERDDIMQDMIEMVISQALYHFDGSFKLSTYINRYFDQCKSIHLKKREILPLRAKVTKHARLYYEAKKALEQNGAYITSQQIADAVNRASTKAKATCETVDELFGLCTLSLDTSFESGDEGGVNSFITNEDNISESSTYSPLFNIVEHVSHNQFEQKIYDFICDKFSQEFATFYIMRNGLFSNHQKTYEQLVQTTGYSKDVLRRRFAEISESLKKEFHESL